MENYYFIPSSAPTGFVAAVMAVSYRAPSERWERIELDLANKGVPAGDVVFDLLLSLSSRERRHFLVPFDGKKLRANGTRRMPRSPELEAWAKGAFKECPFPLDTALLKLKTDLLRLV